MKTKIPSRPIAVVAAVMNRSQPLRYTIPTWLAQPEVRQLILVDWASNDALIDELDHADIPGWPDPRTKIVRVVGQKYWQMGKAINLGMRFVRCSVTFKVDADVAIVRSDLPRFSKSENVFVSGQFLNRDCFSRNSLFGTFMFNTADFLAINGYDERFKSYGNEDNDIYGRLEQLGRRNLTFDENLLFHLPHSDAKRQENQEVKFDCVFKSISETGNALNDRQPWRIDSPRSKFEIVDSFRSPDYVIVREKPILENDARQDRARLLAHQSEKFGLKRSS